MASREQQQEQARAERAGAQSTEDGAARRRQRFLRLVAVAVAAAVAVVIAILVSSGSSSTKHAAPVTSPSQVNPTATAVDQLLAGIPQAANSLGNPSAPVTVTEYADLQCPVCADFAKGSESQLISSDVRSGRVRLVFRSLETATQSQQVFTNQQVAALAAGQQQRAWQFIELFYAEQGTEGSGYVNESYVDGLARQVPGLDYNAWLGARNGSAPSAQVQTDAATAQAQGYHSTPTIVIQGPKGTASRSSGSPATAPSPPRSDRSPDPTRAAPRPRAGTATARASVILSPACRCLLSPSLWLSCALDSGCDAVPSISPISCFPLRARCGTTRPGCSAPRSPGR